MLPSDSTLIDSLPVIDEAQAARDEKSLAYYKANPEKLLAQMPAKARAEVLKRIKPPESQ